MASNTPNKITIMGLLAECSTDDARKLLVKYNMPHAKNKAELELSLARLYKNTDDKKKLERDFAQIHPHRRFLEKYNVKQSPITPKETNEDKIENIINDAKKVTEMPELFSNLTNKKDCNCQNSDFSNCDATNNASTNIMDKDKLIVFGMFGIVSILALIIVSQQIKK